MLRRKVGQMAGGWWWRAAAAGGLGLALVGVAVRERVRERGSQKLVEEAAGAAARLPARMFWVWERSEDLRELTGEHTGAAVLEATVRLGAAGVEVVPRRQPLVLPDGMVRVAVVRVESRVGAREGETERKKVVQELIRVAGGAGLAGLQVDFDARQSERSFYRDLLGETREKMPRGMPLEITALASWCGRDGWMAGLPVNGAVPMMFRMEPDWRRAEREGVVPVVPTAEPLCAGEVGVSADEVWPRGMAGRRLWVFADRGWAADGAGLAARMLAPVRLGSVGASNEEARQ